MHLRKQIYMTIQYFSFWAVPAFFVISACRLPSGSADALPLFLIAVGGVLVLLAWLLTRNQLEYVKLKPLWERPLSLLMLLLSLPVLFLASIIIRLESSGAAFYLQTRIGINRRRRKGDAPLSGAERRQTDLGGRPFLIYKLRSMRNNAEQETGAAWSTGDSDPRITRFGYYIRKTHLDELPQLYNVLRGDMSLIGPRPERPDFIVQLARLIDGYAERLQVPPGITGLSQVRKEFDQSLEDVKEKVQYDREYIRNASLLLDMKIVLKTILLMVNLFWCAIRRRTIEKVEPRTTNVVFADNSRSDR